ncbi:EAL domain-containing protein [Stakelama sp. CBK3Z-3]|uniref:EAL domain-containing protein n=1 Tax=Stakelama flava TaxID=2860338 RepID=A0ABS6XJV9_9SPHN|nr:EAL domain-containing protein [Stakelama flava]MBW4330491.1 EAL domain-containing protein [Stakelama flava]
MLDLLPIPAAIVTLSNGELCFGAVNQPFRHAGLGTAAAQSPLVQHLGNAMKRFLLSRDSRHSFSWELGSSVDCRYFQVTLARRSACGADPQCLVSLVDQTGEQRTEHSLRREMSTDALTGLPNRTGFGDLIDATIDDARRDQYAVLAINLDRFSRINACMGGVSGDELLISVARRLKGALRGRDVLARTGGDEFAILLVLDDGPEDAVQVASRIRGALASPFRLSDFEIRVDCAIGVALGTDNMRVVEDMIRHAQFAVNRAKRTGRTEIYQSQIFALARRQFGIETELRRAIDTGRMMLHYQPICDLATGRVVSFEALARWRNEAGQEIPPSEFIPVAEESGLIVPLGRWAIEEAAKTLSLWDRGGEAAQGVKLAVNLSAIQLQRDDVPQLLQDTLSRYALGGDRITLELTESAIVSDPDRITKLMHALKEIGATLAMDDFGTGYSNLAYLQRLPIDVLKIDRSFVAGMLADRDKIAIVRAVLSLAQALGMATTAEGIETNELAQTLAALGCTYGQGFLYARPLAPNAAYQFLLDRNA